MANSKKDDHTDPNKPQTHHQAFGRSTSRGDLQDTAGEAKAQAAANLKYALASFEVEWREAIKVKDVSFDRLSATFSSKVKASETPPKFGITHDECAKMISEIRPNFSRSGYMTILANLWLGFSKKEEKKPGVHIFLSWYIH